MGCSAGQPVRYEISLGEKIMSITGISSLAADLPSVTSTSNTGVTPTSKKAYFEERNADVAQLNKDVQAGDLSAAQQDYANIVALGKQDIGRNNPYYHADRAMDFNAIGGPWRTEI
jgi:hypothetical protein